MLKLEGHLAVMLGLLRHCLRPLGRHRFVLALSRALRSARTGEGLTLQFLLDIKKPPILGGYLAVKEGFEPSIRS